MQCTGRVSSSVMTIPFFANQYNGMTFRVSNTAHPANWIFANPNEPAAAGHGTSICRKTLNADAMRVAVSPKQFLRTGN